MDDKIFDKIHEVDLKETMETSYIDYAMSVIASRALPDVRDGLKPVQRRVLYSMVELNNGPDKPHRKCARIVGDTMGKFHPHGDSSIYGALVNMAQEWNTRYPLVDGHGNFGSEDGDGAAAMRYTEARMSKLALELLRDWIRQFNPASYNDLINGLSEDFKKRTVMLVDQIPEKQKSRYHINEDALITLPSGEIVAISNQWGIVNIELLIEFVRQNGFVVEKAEQ